jgi:hypothetical protein
MTIEEKQKAIDAIKISAPVMAVTQEEFHDYIQKLNTVMDLLEQQPCGDTRMIDKSNFSMEQYKTDIQSAYDCGKAEDAKFFEFLSNIINPNEMEQYLAMYHSEEEKTNG